MNEKTTIRLEPAGSDAEPPFGFPLDHPYVEHVWASAVGPTSTLLLRRVGVLFRAFPDGLEVDALEFGRSLGLGNKNTQQLMKTFERLDAFSLGAWNAEEGVLSVPSHARPVSGRMLARLPESSRAVHDSLIGSIRTLPTPGRSIVPARAREHEISLDIGA